MTRRVGVAGVGAVTPLGNTWPESVAALAAGATAIRPITRFDASGFPSRVAAPVELAGDGDRRRALADRAAAEAWHDAAIDAAGDRIGVFVGAEAGRPDFATIVEVARRRSDRAALAEIASRLAPRDTSPAAIASRIAATIGAHGPVETVSLACASSAAAIAEAARAIRGGECDVALAGGVGADLDALMLASFGVLGALSARGVSCPFDVRRDGFILGEGAAFVVLAAERARARVELAGIGRTMDAYRLTAPEPEGAAPPARCAPRSTTPASSRSITSRHTEPRRR